MEFVTKYWFLTVIVLLFLIVFTKSAFKNSNGENKVLSILLTLFVFVPPLFLPSEQTLLSVLYSFSVGCIVLLAYYKTGMCMFFRGLEGVSKSMFYPPSKKWLLVIGGILVLVSPIQYALGGM